LTDIRALSTFVWVSQLKSFRRAAAKLNTTQPAVSQRIALLEEQLGKQLLVRNTRSVALTDAGRVVLSYGERLLQLRAEMIASVSDRSRLRGTLRLGVAETIVHTWLPPFLEQMNREYPGIVLEIDVDISANLRDGLLAQRIDLAFMVGPVSAPSIRSRLLQSERLAFLASPRLGFRRRRATLVNIAEMPLITFSRNTRPFVDLEELFNSAKLPKPRIHSSSSIATIVKMALDGLGVAVIPRSIVTREIAAKQLIELYCDAQIPDLQFVAGWLSTPDVGIVIPIAQRAVEISQRQRKSAAKDKR
jgi:DNA-binding transcriptional LysR family regulator